MAKLIFFVMSLMILFMMLHGCCVRHKYPPPHHKIDSVPPHQEHKGPLKPPHEEHKGGSGRLHEDHKGSSEKHSGGESQPIKEGSKIVSKGGKKIIKEIEKIDSKISQAQDAGNSNSSETSIKDVAVVKESKDIVAKAKDEIVKDAKEVVANVKDEIKKDVKDLPKTILKGALSHSEDIHKAAKGLEKAIKSIDMKKVKNILSTVATIASFAGPAASILSFAFAFIPEGPSPEMEKLQDMEKEMNEGFNQTQALIADGFNQTQQQIAEGFKQMSSEIKQAVIEITSELGDIEKELDEGFKSMSAEIKEAVSEIIAENREIQFEDEVQAKMEYIMKSFKKYLKYPGDHPDFIDDCKTNDPSHIITSMLIILKSGGLKKLLVKKDGCAYNSFLKFESFYSNYAKYISIILPFCESIKHKNVALRNESINDFLDDVKTIEELLNDEKTYCEKNFWTNEIDNNGLFILNKPGNAADKAYEMQKWLTDRYGEYDAVLIEGYTCNYCVFAVYVTQDEQDTYVQCAIPQSIKRISVGPKKFMLIFAQSLSSTQLVSGASHDLVNALSGNLNKPPTPELVKQHQSNMNCVLIKTHPNNNVDYSIQLNDGISSNSMEIGHNNLIFEVGAYARPGQDANNPPKFVYFMSSYPRPMG